CRRPPAARWPWPAPLRRRRERRRRCPIRFAARRAPPSALAPAPSGPSLSARACAAAARCPAIARSPRARRRARCTPGCGWRFRPRLAAILATARMAQASISADYVVVGAGSAGCLLANRLSRDPAVKVLLLEAGGQDDWFWIDIPVGYLHTIANPRTDWCYKTSADEHLAGPSLPSRRGRGLGGCSSINAMIYMRG